MPSLTVPESYGPELAGLPLPSAEEEIWRYTRIGDLDLARYTPVPAGASGAPIPESELARLRRLNPAALAVTIDGVLAHLEVSPVAAASGVVLAISDVPVPGIGADPDEVFVRLNRTYRISALALTVPGNVTVSGPVVVVHVLTSPAAAVFPRLAVNVGRNGDVVVLEQFTSTDIDALLVPVTELRAEQDARLKYLALNQLGHQVTQIGLLASVGERDSTTTLASVALGGAYARSRIEARLVGQGAHTEQIAVYFGEGEQLHDFRVLQDHAAPKTTSNLLFKGAVQDTSRSVYTGLIKVRPEARGTSAYQANRNIKLSEGAWADSVPNLDIETNDVKCAHASAVGPIDGDQLFYLESRGVPPGIAERLIVLGFFDEVLVQLPVAGVVDALRAEVAAKLDRRTS